MHHIRVTSR